MSVGFIVKGKKHDIVVLAETLQDAEKEMKKHKKDIEKYLGKISTATSVSPTGTKAKASIYSLILELKAGRFFDKPQNWNDIQQALEGKGYTYPLRSLTEPLRRLVRKRELGRIKKDDKWHYVKR